MASIEEIRQELAKAEKQQQKVKKAVKEFKEDENEGKWLTELKGKLQRKEGLDEVEKRAWEDLIEKEKHLEIEVSNSSVMGSTIKKHPNYLTLENCEFLDELTSEEIRIIKKKYAHINKNSPNRNNDWKRETQDVHPWVQEVYKSLAEIW
ncbi:11277_t:CDS:2 [Funneliformis caledonium]|uniref:11277_t:CDS:1 n=1 Tax=Funneliformis caledonium TaxID=1117310 RepID=A0A9N9DLD1_9GLOM|nr:11277_t:CDS:2 [Funneliformis caledonium]